MKILFSAEAYPHKGNQFAAFIKVISEEFVRQGHEVTIIAPQSLTRVVLRKSPLLPVKVFYRVPTERGDKEVCVIRPYSLTFGYGKYLKYSYWFNKKAFECACGKYVKECDVIYSHFWTSGYNALDVARKSDKPLFVTTGEDRINIRGALSDGEIEKLRKIVRGVICVSTKNKEESVELGLAAQEKCIVIPNAINQKEFYKKDKKECRRSLGFPNDAFIVSFCGRFIERKGVNRVSEAIKKLKDSNVKSIFIGQNAEGQSLQPDCDGILFEGPLPHNQMVDYLNSADVYVLPTLAEGCSNSIIEAMACGLPIISSDLPFNHDIINDENSIMIDPMNVNQIANAIAKIRDDDELRSSMSTASLKMAQSLTIERRVRRIMEYIKENG